MPAMKRLVVVGAGGHAREVLDLIDAINADRPQYDVVGLLADWEPDPAPLAVWELDWLGSIRRLEELDPDVAFVIGIGDSRARRDIDARISGRDSPVLVHPNATVGRAVALGPGSVVCSHVSITTNIRCGRHVHVNRGATIGHDTVLGDHATLSPGVSISGNVTVGDSAFLGTGAVVNPGLTVGAGATVGSGAVVIRDVDPGLTVVGVPARPLAGR